MKASFIIAGGFCRTRDGRKATIYATDGAGNRPVHGAIDGEIDDWREDGRWFADGPEDEYGADLVGPWGEEHKGAEFGKWFSATPPRTQPGTTSDYFLTVGIDSDVPQVLVYQHDEGTWTSGGGDTQHVRLWAHIPPRPNEAGKVTP